MTIADRPIPVTIGCLSAAALSLYLVFGALTPAVSPVGSEYGWLVATVAIFSSMGFVVAYLAWSRIAWSRWLLLLWFFVPLAIAGYGDAERAGQGYLEYFMPRIVRSWEGWLVVGIVVLLSLPSSSHWFKGRQHAAP